MKGFIIALHRAKNEDMVVVLLSEHFVGSYYRFFGARHSILQLGYLIDYESEGEDGRFMPRLRKVTHLGFSWLYDNNRLLAWHNFIKLFAPHLRDTEDIDSFYYHLLLDAALKWGKQNPKRIICESYVKLLQYEGRLHEGALCHVCETPLGDAVSFMQTLIPVHAECIYAPSLPRAKVDSFFQSGKTILLDDEEVEYLHVVIMRGL